ncbi:MAG TPA: hypothetical protein VLD65_11270 [Anaerolineales bacterium]|nr:hypothetical protein [Anaerolineales bacterium]
MKDFFLYDPNEIRLPPEDVRLTQVEVKPLPNGRQVKIHLELTPFMKRPNLEVSITSQAGNEVGHTSILETMHHQLEFTMHLRQVEPGDELSMETTIYYQKLPEPSETPMDMALPDPMVVDRNRTIFKLTPAGI